MERIVRPAGKNQSIVGNPYLPIGGHESQSRSRLCQTDIILGSVQCRCKVIDTKNVVLNILANVSESVSRSTSSKCSKGGKFSREQTR